MIFANLACAAFLRLIMEIAAKAHIVSKYRSIEPK